MTEWWSNGVGEISPLSRMTNGVKHCYSDGVVLIMALILSAIIYLAVSTLLLITMTEIHLADFEQRSTQAFYAAEGAITEGIARLRADHKISGWPWPISDDISIGGNVGTFTVKVEPKVYDDYEPWYHLVVQGEGVISGSKAATTRTVEREIVIKPFVLFAREEVVLQGLCNIEGNIHGNLQVTIGDSVSVEGDISSHANIVISDDATVEGENSVQEPEISLPEIPLDQYIPTYRYNDQIYQAQQLLLSHSFILSSGVGEPPGTQLKLYKAAANPVNNPAGIFYLNDTIDDVTDGTLTAFDVQGTVILRSSEGLALKGIINIQPVADFPALIKTDDADLSIRFFSFFSLEPFLDVNDSKIADIPKSNSIKRLLYTPGSVRLAADTGSAVVEGSILGRNITIVGGSTFKVEYDPKVMTSSPPGLQLVEYGAWREIIN